MLQQLSDDYDSGEDSDYPSDSASDSESETEEWQHVEVAAGLSTCSFRQWSWRNGSGWKEYSRADSTLIETAYMAGV